ncbi:hypothetical protein ACRALDRAFT_2022715 [Sodiomyces alcalophilus JCM 7366]|uniref:uncharacterized protein n=1 Tax=Sodiomyces alcalophilus JCM 7366 TaxID=591952 RepID=UPI0039B57266
MITYQSKIHLQPGKPARQSREYTLLKDRSVSPGWLQSDEREQESALEEFRLTLWFLHLLGLKHLTSKNRLACHVTASLLVLMDIHGQILPSVAVGYTPAPISDTTLEPGSKKTIQSQPPVTLKPPKAPTRSDPKDCAEYEGRSAADALPASR